MSERNQTATAPAGYDIQTMSDEQLRTVGMIRISKAAAICREQGRHWDSDAVIIDRNYADYCADLIEAGAPAQGQQVGQEPVYVECRECAGCGHVGINDSLETHSACDRCAWIGRSPAEDKCPGCAYENTMSAACPKCGCIYRLLADAEITTPQPAPAQDVAGQPMQPIVFAERGVIRFKQNAIVRHLLDYASSRGCSLNELARMDFSDDDRMQLAQLIGYSVSGYGDLSYASRESVERADAIAAALSASTGQEVGK